MMRSIKNANMSKQGKSIVVVLGMHRSGTSAITRGLQVMGVNLGNQLMPPVAGNNEKGFFEDTAVSSINSELLGAMGQDWHTLAFVHTDELLDKKYADFNMPTFACAR